MIKYIDDKITIDMRESTKPSKVADKVTNHDKVTISKIRPIDDMRQTNPPLSGSRAAAVRFPNYFLDAPTRDSAPSTGKKS